MKTKTMDIDNIIAEASKSIDDVKSIISENTFSTVKILLENDYKYVIDESDTKSSNIDNKE